MDDEIRSGPRDPVRDAGLFFGFLGGANSYLQSGRALRGAILRGTEPVVETEYLTDAFGREAVDFIERHRDHPFLARWPGRFPAGAVCSDPVTSLDIHPTLLAAAGAPVPAEAKLDGVDLRPFLSARTLTPPHDTLYFRFGEQRALRRGPWKIVQGPSEDDWALYDLSTDIGETKDLARTHPGKLAELAAAWEAWDAELPDPLWKRQGRRGRSK